jgi:crossover junction endodeoxyribonuclease RusA
VKTVLHIRIPGEPHVQERHRWGKVNTYDPSAAAKEDFQWQVKAAAPTLKPSPHPLGILITVWSTKKPIKKRKTGKLVFQTDWDNYGKFYSDAMNGLAYEDDSQIIDARVIVYRYCPEAAVEILLWENGV